LRGVSEATGIIGPNLTNITLRPTLAGGAVPNTPENLARWMMNPPALKEGAAMPPIQSLSEQQARDVAAFLYSVPFNAQ
jgi:cytochrome c oxidase subunit 2